MIGVELTDTSARAVALDADGRVTARATESSGDLASAALAAIAAVAPSGGTAQATAAAAFAALFPESPTVVAAMRSLGARTAPGADALPPSGVAAAAAEAWVGAARGRGDVVFFATAEHTTAGILKNGAPMSGASGRAASAAWLALNPVEREDYRRAGCLEAEVAAAGIVRRLIWRIKAGDRSRISDRVNGDLTLVTLEHVLEAARSGDGVSISVMRDTAKYLGMAAANLVAICDPEILVLGGIMGSAADLLLEPVRVEMARRLPPAMIEVLAVEPGSLGADAAAIGAARLALVPRS